MKTSSFAPFWVAMIIAGAGIALGFLSSSDVAGLYQENGPVEVASVAVWILAALTMVWLSPRQALGERWHVTALFLLFAAREMDFDKRFLSQGVFKARLYSGDSPITEKIIGLCVIAVVLTIVIRLLRRNWRDIWPGVRNGVLWVQVAVLAVLSAVISKTIDGAGRKLQGFGISLSETAEFRLAIVEEILELGFGVLVVLAVCLFHRSQEPGPRG